MQGHGITAALRHTVFLITLTVSTLGIFVVGPARADTVFTATCFGNTTVDTPPCGSTAAAALGLSATIDFSGTVPLDGSSFSGPATLSVTEDGLSGQVTFPASDSFTYTQSANPAVNYSVNGGPETHGPVLQTSSGFTLTLAGSSSTPSNFIGFAGLGGGGIADFEINQGGTADNVGVVFTASPAPSLYLTTGTGGDLSLSFQPTEVNATVTLSNTPIPNSVQLPVPIPSGDTTLQQVANDLGYTGFDWLQTFTAPNPALVCTNPGCSSPVPFSNATTAAHDPPQYGYASCNPNSILYKSLPSSLQYDCSNSYPFYYPSAAATNSPQTYCVYYASGSFTDPCTTYLADPSDTILSFSDTPLDPCLETSLGTPSPFYILYPSVRAACNNSTASGQLDYTTELVGILSGGGYQIIPGSQFVWEDDFDGGSFNGDTGTGGVWYPLAADLPLAVDGTTGYGGVTILSSNNIGEPPSMACFIVGFVLLVACRASSKARFRRGGYGALIINNTGGAGYMAHDTR